MRFLWTRSAVPGEYRKSFAKALVRTGARGIELSYALLRESGIGRRQKIHTAVRQLAGARSRMAR